MRRRSIIAIALGSLLVSLQGPPIQAADKAPLRVLSTMAVQGAFTDLQPLIAERTGVPVDIEFSATVPITERIQKGEAADLVILAKRAVETLASEGRVLAQRDLMISEEGIAVAESAPTPVIRTVDDFKAVVSAAPSIAVTSRGVSGLRFRKMLADFGLAELMAPRLVLVDEGFTGTRLINGEVAMAVQQISELKLAGAKNIVRLPDELQSPTTFTVAVLKTTARPQAAEAAVAVMASPDAAPAYVRSGVQPLVPAGTGQDPVRILAPAYTREAVAALIPRITAQTGLTVKIDTVGTGGIVNRLIKGERIDLVVTSKASLTGPAKARILAETDVAISPVAIAVADTAPTPILATPEDVAAFLKATPSFAHSTGPSGVLTAGVIAELGLVDVMKPKTQTGSGLMGTRLVKGEVAAVAQQVSELKLAGLTNIVPLPPSFGAEIPITAATVAGTDRAGDVKKIVEVLAAPEAAKAYEDAGLRPLAK